MSAPATRRVGVVRLQLVRERTAQYAIGTPDQLNGPSDVVLAARAITDDMDREAFIVMYLDAKHRINALEVTAVGTLSAMLVHPREVFKGALLANAAAVVVAHNHPSGDPTPSPEDHALTKQLLDAGELIGIRVMDHVVIGDGRWVSLRETSQMWLDRPFHR